MKNTILFILVFVALSFIQINAQTYTTLAGGPWNEPSTWENSEVPQQHDDVVIRGPVQVDVLTVCRKCSNYEYREYRHVSRRFISPLHTLCG